MEQLGIQPCFANAAAVPGRRDPQLRCRLQCKASRGRWGAARIYAQAGSEEGGVGYVKTEDTFAKDAGEDLFFTGMGKEQAIEILGTEYERLKDLEDRYIAVERLKFFKGPDSSAALLKCISEMEVLTLQCKIARRKAVEVLGRYKGEFQRDEVVAAIRKLLFDEDQYTVEVSVWALQEIGITEPDVLEDIASVLDREDGVPKRVVIKALTELNYKPALERISMYADDSDGATASCAMSAMARMGGDVQAMSKVAAILRSDVLDARRAAIEDITAQKYTPAMQAVVVAPNALILRSRALRTLLDEAGEERWNDETERLVDRLIWDHPLDLDLLGKRNKTKKSRQLERNVERMTKNDALPVYLACKTICELDTEAGHGDNKVGDFVLKSFLEQPYFDYFAAYHFMKTLGWLRVEAAYNCLLENWNTLPPRFFNHQLAAGLALARLGNSEAVKPLSKVARETRIWELKYAAFMAVEMLGDGGALRESLKQDEDWLIRRRAQSTQSFDHLTAWGSPTAIPSSGK